MLCRRSDLELVLFQVETKWGMCTQSIPRGDMTPRDLGGIRRLMELPRLGSWEELPNHTNALDAEARSLRSLRVGASDR